MYFSQILPLFWFTRPYIGGKGNRRIPKKFKVISKSLILLSRSQLSTGHDKSKSRTKEDKYGGRNLKHFAHLRWTLPSCLSLQSTIYSHPWPPPLLRFHFINSTTVHCWFNSIHNIHCGCKNAEAWNTWAFSNTPEFGQNKSTINLSHASDPKLLHKGVK